MGWGSKLGAYIRLSYIRISKYSTPLVEISVLLRQHDVGRGD